MANRYVIKFTKTGYAKYTSHLDMLRFFKRAFRKSGISLRYSKGFNPHPKLSFAQPLSLGYSSSCELLEFETEIYHDPVEIFSLLLNEMPEGMEIKQVEEMSAEVKSLASSADSAEYIVEIPFDMDQNKLKEICSAYIEQEEIIALKRRKKDKKMVPVDIKNMIRSLEANTTHTSIVLKMDLDCGSVSNCSPELVISSFLEFADIKVPRYKIEVERTKLEFV